MLTDFDDNSTTTAVAPLNINIIVGPVIGYTDATSSRILYEFDGDTVDRVECVAEPLFFVQQHYQSASIVYRPREDTGSTGTKKKQKSSCFACSSNSVGPKYVETKVHNCKQVQFGTNSSKNRAAAAAGTAVSLENDSTPPASKPEPRQAHETIVRPLSTKRNVPVVVKLEGLQPNYGYRVYLRDAITRQPLFSMDRDARFRTQALSNDRKATYMKLACVSCNEIVDRDKSTPDMWQLLAFEATSLDLIIHMGDQVYLDMGENVWEKAMHIAGKKTPLSDEKQHQIYEIFANVYRRNWSHPPTQRTLANAPNVMMWDDHEFCNSWGSTGEHRDPDSVEFQVGLLARECFLKYQKSLVEDVFIEGQPPPSIRRHEAYRKYLADDVLLVMLDLRAGRSFAFDGKKTFLGEQQWRDLRYWMFDEPSVDKVKVLLLMSSVPLVFAEKTLTTIAESVFGDLEDYWQWGSHAQEQEDICEMLLNWKNAKPNRRVIELTGDLHVGIMSEAYDKDGNVAFEQLMASAIATKPPDGFHLSIIEKMTALGGDSLNGDNGMTFKHLVATNKNNYGIVEVVRTPQWADDSDALDVACTLRTW